MYGSITLTKNGRAAIAYAEGSGKGHNGHKHRNLMVTPINLIPGVDYADQMQRNWNLKRKNHKNEILRIVCSFSKKELDPDKEGDVLKANHILKTFVENRYPGHEAVIYLQADGRGHMLHGHVLISDVHMETHKACKNEQKHVAHVRRWLNEEASKLIDLDLGKKSEIHRTRTERALEEKAEKIRAEHPDISENELTDILIDEKAYSYKADLRARIQKTAENTNNEEEFMTELERSGITVVKKNSKKYGPYYKYTFDSCPIKILHKTVSSKKLGFAFSPEGIGTIWAAKNKGKNTAGKPASGFTKWVQDTGQSYIKFDDKGKFKGSDFEKLEQLHNEYEAEKNTDKNIEITISDKEKKNEEFKDLPKAAKTNNNRKERARRRRSDMRRRVRSDKQENNVIQGAAELLLAQQRAALAHVELPSDPETIYEATYDDEKE